MSYSALITHVQPDSEAAPRLACAVATARRFDAALIGVAAEMIPPLAFDGGFYSLEADWTTAMRETIEERLRMAREAFAKATEGFGERAAFASGLELPCPALAAASRAADLIVAGGAPHGGDAYRTCSPAELAITSGRPVLVAPPSAPPLRAEHVMVAWKDTREARRALSDALPFLEAAQTVTVVAICAEIDTASAKVQVEDVARALTRRGVHAACKVVTHAHADGFQVLRQAAAIDADLIVLGAYGHSRLGEWVFGGVTADLLAQDQAYLLLSH
jgi:nucleotide-binding universal stress UspA family protein